MKTTGKWLWVSSDEYLDHDWSAGDEGMWTCAKDTHVGDLVIMYERGAKCLRWMAQVEGEPVPEKRWGFECEFRVIAVFDPPIPVAQLASYKPFVKWGTYRAHFQGSKFAVPDDVWRVFEKACGTATEDVDIARVARQADFDEGFRRQTVASRAERNPKVVEEAKRIHGTTCFACGFDFGAAYGERGDGFIEIHHLKPVSMRGKKGSKTNVATDVVPLCSNCHRMVHRGDEMLTPLQLKALVVAMRRRRTRAGAAG